MKKMIPAFLLFVFGVSLNCQSQHGSIPSAVINFLKGKKTVDIPFERFKGWIILKVKVNNVKTFSFLLDTGAPINILRNEEDTSGLKLTFAGNITVAGEGGNKPKSVPLAHNVKFLIGDVEINQAFMAIGMSKDILSGLDGILGKCFFENVIMSINWTKSIITLTKKDNYTYTGKGTTLPLYIMPTGHLATDIVLENLHEKISTKAIVDLGNKSSFFVDKTFGAKLIDSNHLIKDVIAGWGASGSTNGDVGRTNVGLGNFNFKDVVTIFRKQTGFAQQNVYANIGLSILERFNIILDYSGKKLLLEKNEKYATPFLYNQTGIINSPKREGNFIIIAAIISSSPAEQAGIKPGDKIISANGITPEIKDITKLENIISGKETTQVELVIQRGDTTIKKKIKVRRLI